MRHAAYSVVLLLVAQGVAFGLTKAELHRLAAYEAYLVATSKAPEPEKPSGPSKPGVCPECDGSGKVGDGTVFVSCGRCGGTGKVGASGDFGSASPPEQPKPVQKPKPEPVQSPVKEPPVTRSPGPRWNVEGNWNYSTEELADHLSRVHGVNVDGKTRSELEALHDSLHNAEVRSSAPVIQSSPMQSCPNGQCPTSRSTQSCPNGQCPTSQPIQSYSRRGFRR
jgi:hypothetical protein